MLPESTPRIIFNGDPVLIYVSRWSLPLPWQTDSEPAGRSGARHLCAGRYASVHSMSYTQCEAESPHNRPVRG